MTSRSSPQPLTHLVEGEGAPVLLLNGGLMTIASWDPIAAPLAARFRVIRCDLRGQLLSPGTPPRSIEGHAAEVVALLDHLGIETTHLVGTSYGGFVASALAARAPGRVASLVLAATSDRVTESMTGEVRALRAAAREAADGGDGGVLYDLIVRQAYSPAFRETNRERLSLYRGVVAAMPRSWFRQLDLLLAALENLDMRPHLAAVGCPTLVVAADRDATFPPAHSEAIARAVPGARLEVLPDTGHALVVERPDAFASLAGSFLASIVSAGKAVE